MLRCYFAQFLLAVALFCYGSVAWDHAEPVSHSRVWRSSRSAATTTDQRIAALKAVIESSLTLPSSPSSAKGRLPQVSILRTGNANGLKIIRKATGGGGPKPSCRAANEAYGDCGADCQLVCGLPVPDGGCRGHCKPGCICRHGYIRSSVAVPCVPMSRCQPDCGPNHKFEECASLCPAYCDVRPRRGVRLCRMNACVCADGYLLAKNGTTCIPRDRCKRF
nr:uncharacterized protein LOC119185311 [Rhipicephalus microplus]